MANFTTKVLNKRHGIFEVVFNNMNRVVLNMNSTTLNRMSTNQYHELTSAIKTTAFCDRVDGKGNNTKSICGTFNC